MTTLRTIVSSLTLVLLGSAAFAQTSETFQFTVGSGYTLTNAYIVYTNTSGLYAGDMPLNEVYTAGTYSGTIDNTDNLNLMAVFTDSTGTQRVAISLPGSTASTILTQNLSWDPNSDGVGFDTNTYWPIELLPNEANTVTDMMNPASFNTYVVYPGFTYLPSNALVLQQPGTVATIVGFDGAEPLGTFTYQAVPEPSELIPLGIACLAGLASFRRRR